MKILLLIVLMLLPGCYQQPNTLKPLTTYQRPLPGDMSFSYYLLCINEVTYISHDRGISVMLDKAGAVVICQEK